MELPKIWQTLAEDIEQANAPRTSGELMLRSGEFTLQKFFQYQSAIAEREIRERKKLQGRSSAVTSSNAEKIEQGGIVGGSASRDEAPQSVQGGRAPSGTPGAQPIGALALPAEQAISDVLRSIGGGENLFARSKTAPVLG